MREKILPLFSSNNISSHLNTGVLIVNAADENQGLQIAKQLLYSVADKRTALFLSGGKTPLGLYEDIAKDALLLPGIVALVDERYGDPMHAESNEKMLVESGLMRYFTARDIAFRTVLHGLPVEETALRYDEQFRTISAIYPKLIGIMGIGTDGHTAGIAGERSSIAGSPFHNRMFDDTNKLDMVSWFTDPSGPFKTRISLTFLGISMLDLDIILAFGAEKFNALEMMLKPGSVEEIPARVYTKPEIASKTILITDQKL